MNSYSSNWNTPYLSLFVTAGEFQKCNLDVRKNDMQWNSVLNLKKSPQKRMVCFRLLLEHLAWIEHQFWVAWIEHESSISFEWHKSGNWHLTDGIEPNQGNDCKIAIHLRNAALIKFQKEPLTCLWGMMRGVGGVSKSMHHSWLAKGWGLGLLCWGFKGVQEEIPWEETSTLQIGSVAFPPGQCTSPQLHPCHILFDQDGHQDSSSPSL